MKKIIKALCLLLLLGTAFIAVSCGAGKSVPLHVLKSKNSVAALLDGGVCAYSEKVEYTEKNLSYEIYIELSDNIAYTYNVCEKAGDYTLFAVDGDVYTEKGGDLCAVLFSNQALNYYQYISDYVTSDFPLDAGERYQRFSENDGDFTVVEYCAAVTPQIASSVYSTELSVGDKIISVYKLDDIGRICCVEYKIEHAGTAKTVARRSFEYFTAKKNVFSSLPREADAKVSLVIGEKEYSYDVPSGVYVGFEDGGLGYEYYLDENRTLPYDFADYGKLKENLVIFVK
ncbi:MAG: hypothetical protein KBS59_02565 [Clostridiales bacterium]|nr:hypothetical protein [Clostridiales bacterium]